MKIGFLDILTIAFIVLKLTGVIDWNWLLVLSPELVSIILTIIEAVLLSIGKD